MSNFLKSLTALSLVVILSFPSVAASVEGFVLSGAGPTTSGRQPFSDQALAPLVETASHATGRVAFTFRQSVRRLQESEWAPPLQAILTALATGVAGMALAPDPSRRPAPSRPRLYDQWLEFVGDRSPDWQRFNLL